METVPYRVNYREDQRLRAADLTAEQEYLIELERSHNRTLHAAGIVLGLEARAGWTDALARHPGVAIDAEGRALVLLQMQEIAAPPDGQCIDSWLVFCAAPRRIRRPGMAPCGPDAYDRWSEFVRVVDVPVAETDPAVAPEPGAVYLGRRNDDSPPEIPYTALAAARTTGPRGDMVMWVGPETSRDRNGFSVRAAGEATPRLAIDRLGVNRLNGTVTLSDYHACAHLELPGHQMLIVQALDTGRAGLKMHFRIQPEPAGQTKAVRIAFFAGSQKLGEDLILRQDGDFAAEIKSFAGDIKRLPAGRMALKVEKALETTRVPVKAEPAAGAVASPSVAELAFFDTEDDIGLNPCGGMLSLCELKALTNAAPPPQRGCLPAAPSDEPVREPNGLTFEAMPATPEAPPQPGAYSVQTGDAAQPAQEFRLDLGEKRDNDQNTRLSFVHREAANQPYTEWVRISGVGAMHIGGPIPNKNDRPIDLRVSGTIQLAPIKPDPANPHFTKLLVLAWLAGLRRSVEESTVVALAFGALLPPMIETGKSWAYSLVITNNGPKEITVGGAVETQTVAGQSSTFLKNITGTIAPGGHASFQINHAPNDTPAGSLMIEIEAFSKIGTPPWRKSMPGGPIQVVQRPEIGFDGFPDSVPPGASWEQSFTFRNPASRALTLNSVTIAEGNGVPQSLISAPLLIPTGGSRTFVLPTHPGITADLRFTIESNFTWDSGLVSALDDQRTIRVERDLRTQFVLPASVSVGDDLTFDIILTNQSGQDVTLTALHYRITSADFPPTARTDILPAHPPTLADGDALPLLGVHGIVVPPLTATTPTNRIQVELDMEYVRGARPLHPQPVVSNDIPIT